MPGDDEHEALIYQSSLLYIVLIFFYILQLHSYRMLPRFCFVHIASAVSCEVSMAILHGRDLVFPVQLGKLVGWSSSGSTPPKYIPFI